MTLKDIWLRARSKTSSWLRAHRPSTSADYQPQLDNEGLIEQDDESAKSLVEEEQTPNDQVEVKAIQPASKTESLEKLQEGFNRLIEQLEGINEHLNRQITQNEDLMSRMDKLPKMLEGFPAIVENQRQLTERLFEQLKAAAVKDQQFIDAVEKIPAEAARQSDCLADINHQLAAAADTDVQMAEGFNKFNETLDKLNQNTVGQTDSILQMSKTFATSDRYLKYLWTRQNKRFVWIFIIAISVCVLAILILAGVIIYLRQ
jgi:soluble cytochrome b562